MSTTIDNTIISAADIEIPQFTETDRNTVENTSVWEQTSIEVETQTGEFTEIKSKRKTTVTKSVQNDHIPKNDGSVWNGTKKWPSEGKDEREFPKERNPDSVLPAHLVLEIIEREHDCLLHDAKEDFFNRGMGFLKKNNYFLFFNAYNIIDYLPPNSAGFFRLIVDHFDESKGKIGRLWQWNFNRNPVFIVAIDDNEEGNKWFTEHRDFYNSVANTHQDEGGKFSEKGYGILRSNAIRDFSSNFLKLHFFSNYESAKTMMLINLSGRITFLNKESNTTA
jgi:hypothetical protein